MRTSVILTMILWCVCGSQRACAGVVRWDNIDMWEENSDSNAGLYKYAIGFEQNEEATDYTGMFFDYDSNNSTIAFENMTVDEGSEWFFVSNGDVISKDLLDSGAYVPFNQRNIPVVVPNHFYLAGKTYMYEHPDADVYGWIEFLQTPTGLEMRDNAAAYGAASLATGSFDFVPVPEPSTWLLLLLGATTLTAAGIRSNRHATGRA